MRKPDPEEGPDFDFPDEPSLAKPQRTYYQEDYKRTNNKFRQKVYALITDTSQTVTPDEYKALPSRKRIQEEAARAARTAQIGAEKPAKGGKLPFLRSGKVLSQKDADELYEPLCAALKSDFEYLDKGIWLYAMDQDERPIWSNMAREEVQVLAEVMLKRGQHSPEAAAAVRAIVDSDIWIQVGAITVPRVIQTYKVIKGSPRPMINKQRREARREARKERIASVNRA